MNGDYEQLDSVLERGGMTPPWMPCSQLGSGESPSETTGIIHAPRKALSCQRTTGS